MKNKAFTLSEVLITLGIIGVVAAMTLPSLINDKKHKELQTAFKKSYSALSQVTLQVVTQEYGGTTPSIEDNSLGEFMTNYQKYYIKSVSCTRSSTNCPTSVFPMDRGSQLEEFLRSNYKTFNGNSNPAIQCNDGIMALTDGSFLFFNLGASTETVYGMAFIAVDTNGWRKKPNRYGQDFFLFQVNSKGQLMAMGADGTYFPEKSYCSITSTSPSNGYGCTSMALNNPDYFKNLP